MKKLIVPLVAVALFIVAVGIFSRKMNITMPTPGSTPVQIAPSVAINDKKITVSVADSAEERQKGLSTVNSLEKDSGMLFVFEDVKKAQTFWMKGVLIPLDIIWIAKGKIIKIDKNVPIPTPGTPDEKLTTYSAGRIVDYVLEVNAGYSDTNSIKVGDQMTFSGI